MDPEQTDNQKNSQVDRFAWFDTAIAARENFWRISPVTYAPSPWLYKNKYEGLLCWDKQSYIWLVDIATQKTLFRLPAIDVTHFYQKDIAGKIRIRPNTEMYITFNPESQDLSMQGTVNIGAANAVSMFGSRSAGLGMGVYAFIRDKQMRDELRRIRESGEYGWWKSNMKKMGVKIGYTPKDKLMIFVGATLSIPILYYGVEFLDMLAGR